MQFVMAGVIGVICIAFLFTMRTVPDAGSGGGGVDAIVRVGDQDPVLLRDYEATLRLAQPWWTDKSLKQLGAQLGMPNLKEEFPRWVYQGLVERELLRADAERVGLDVSPEAVDELLRDGIAHFSFAAAVAPRLYGTQTTFRPLPVRPEGSEKFDFDRYQRILQSLTGQSPREFKEFQRREIVAARMRELIRTRVAVSDDEAFLEFARDTTRGVARYVPLTRDWFSRYAVDLSSAAAEAWGKAHAELVEQAWSAKRAAYAPGCVLVESLNLGPLPDEAKVAEAKRRLAAGEALGAVARDAGAGEGAVSGGELVCANSLDAALVDAARELPRGKVAGPLEVAAGTVLLRGAGPLAAEADKAEAFGRLQVTRGLAEGRLASEAIQAAAEQIRQAVTAEKLPLQDAVAKVVASLTGKLSGAEKQRALASDARPTVVIGSSFALNGEVVAGESSGQGIARRVLKLEPDALLDGLVATDKGSALVQLKSKEAATREAFQSERARYLGALTSAKEREALTSALAEKLAKAEAAGQILRGAGYPFRDAPASGAEKPSKPARGQPLATEPAPTKEPVEPEPAGAAPSDTP